MNGKLAAAVTAGWLGRRLGLDVAGPDVELDEVCALSALTARRLSFVLAGREPGPSLSAGAVFGRAELAARGLTVLVSVNPRLDFIRAQHVLAREPGYLKPARPPDIHPSVELGPGARIENGVSIGEGTYVGGNVVIRSGTRIGRHCHIKSGAVIGEAGFGFERGEDGKPLGMLHIGGVSLGDYVDVGSLTTVCRGALGDTVLESYVKLDDHVHVAHNCRVGEGTIIAACAELSGSVTVGRYAWIGPNASVIQKVELGDCCLVGLGAVVIRDVEPGAVVAGNPARPIRPRPPGPLLPAEGKVGGRPSPRPPLN